jgi:hypothetical protein
MRKRYFIVAALFASLASVGFVAALLMSNGPGVTNAPGVTKANFDRIEKGMTLQEVEQILGSPGKYTWGGYHWEGDDGVTAFVEFDFDGASAGGKSWQDSRESPLDKIWCWLHLR